MAEWTHRLCERCWFDGPSMWPEDRIPGVFHDGPEAGEYRLPSQVKDVEPGACCSCGGLTITGIFVRADEQTLLCRGCHEQPELWSCLRVVPHG